MRKMFLTETAFGKKLSRINDDIQKGNSDLKIIKHPFVVAKFLYEAFFYSPDIVNGRRAYPRGHSLAELANSFKLCKNPANKFLKKEEGLPTYTELRKILESHDLIKYIKHANRTIVGDVLEDYFQKELVKQEVSSEIKKTIDRSERKSKRYTDQKFNQVNDRVTKVSGSLEDRIKKLEDKMCEQFDLLHRKIEEMDEPVDKKEVLAATKFAKEQLLIN